MNKVYKILNRIRLVLLVLLIGERALYVYPKLDPIETVTGKRRIKK